MVRHSVRLCVGLALLAWSATTAPLSAAVQTYGDMDVLGTSVYPSDPTTGAMLEGLAADVVTFGVAPTPHNYPFLPSDGEFPGTDRIYVGSVQTTSHDGYSSSNERVNGPQVLTLDYASLVPQDQTVASLTLGIAADDFQFLDYGQPFSAAINGAPAGALTTTLNNLGQSGPLDQYFTIGISPNLLNPSHTLTLAIDGLGEGGDGWAIDFLTVGVTTVPEPTAIWLAAVMGYGLLVRRAP